MKMDKNKTALRWPGGAPLRESEIVLEEGERFLASPKRRWMCIGQQYYAGEHDMARQTRKIIGENGTLTAARHLSDQRICHPFLRELIDQKGSYLLGRPFSLRCEQEQVAALLTQHMDEAFAALLMRWARDAMVTGIGWIHVHYDKLGMLRLRRMRPEEMAPLWTDDEHSQLAGMIRCFEREEYHGRERRIIPCMSIWDQDGVRHYRKEGGRLRPDDGCGPAKDAHFIHRKDGREQTGGFGKTPFIPLRYNDDELPLIQTIKSMIDAYDRIVSDNSNALADQPNSILVLKNYDGQNLGEFRRNLSAFRAVKVSDDGGVEALNTPLDHQAATAQLERLRHDIYALGRGIDHRAERFHTASSGVALKHEYAALDLDCNALEWQCKVALRSVCDFLLADALRHGRISAEVAQNAKVDFVFNRDIIINEEAAINMVQKSKDLISERTALANHPWVSDVGAELAARQNN